MAQTSASWRNAVFCYTALLLPCVIPNTALAAAGDGDNDGVADAADVAPCDANIASLTAVPAEGQFAQLAFEDQWPSQGDYDFNDFVVNYSVEVYKNAAGQVTQVRYILAPKAMGALFDNGFAVHLPVAKTGVSAQLKLGSGSFSSLNLESGESEVVVRVAESIRATFFGGASNQINTDEARATVTPTNAELVFNFATPVTLNATKAPFDVFIFRSGQFGHQIHLPGELGTEKMDQTLWGSQDDNTNYGGDPVGNGLYGGDPIVAGRYGSDPLNDTFEDKRGVPFVLNVPVNAAITQEGKRIDALFPRIVDFAASGGAQFSNFHSVNVNTNLSFRNTLPTPPSISQIAARTNGSCLFATLSDATAEGLNCLDIKNRGLSRGSGKYRIDPDGASGGTAIEVFCDMVNHDGGWTLIGAGLFYQAQTASLSVPGSTNAIFNTAIRTSIINSTGKLFRTGPNPTTSLFVKDPAPNFDAHFWRSSAAVSDIKCANDYSQVTSNTMRSVVKQVNCDATGVGVHSCGSQNGWILWHVGKAYNFSGAHPCPFGSGESGPTLGDLWVR